MLRVAPLIVMLLAAASASCRSAEEKARDEFRSRLSSAAPLSRDEIARLIEETSRAMSGRVVRVQEGPMTRELDDRGRAGMFELLSGHFGVQDAGARTLGSANVRGLRGPATPSMSEVDANQTLWIDTETLLPRRYEMTYSMPGFGDVGYDLTFDSSR